jgi:hypothetical protein
MAKQVSGRELQDLIIGFVEESQPRRRRTTEVFRVFRSAGEGRVREALLACLDRGRLHFGLHFELKITV